MLDGKMGRLTRMEYRLLALLVEHAGEMVPRPIVLMQIKGYGPKKGRLRVAEDIRGLRQKLGIYADQYIETVTEPDTGSDPCQSFRFGSLSARPERANLPPSASCMLPQQM